MWSLLQALLHLASQDLKCYKRYEDWLLSAVTLTPFHNKLICSSLWHTSDSDLFFLTPLLWVSGTLLIRPFNEQISSSL